MTTAADIINLWPSPAHFAADLGLASAVHARTMRTRGSIPRWYWDSVISGAKARGLKVERIDLETAHAKKRQLGVIAAIASEVAA